MKSTRVTCAHCHSKYNPEEETNCPNCGSTVTLENAPIVSVPPTTEITEPKEPPYTGDLGQAVKNDPTEDDEDAADGTGCIAAVALGLFALIFASMCWMLYQGEQIHKETLTVVGFSWRIESEVEHANGVTIEEVLEGTGKNVPTFVPEASVVRVITLETHLYVHLDREHSVTRVFEVDQALWDRLEFNDKVSAEVTGYDEIVSIAAP